MLLDLTDEETLALHDLLNTTIETARYPVSPRIRMLRGTLTKLRLTARVLERRTPVKAEAVGAAAAELDRRELARELQSVPTGGDLNRQVLERQLCEFRAGGGRDGVAAGGGRAARRAGRPRPPPR